jgi:D-3-phosphoglycerate dehydrogenase
MPTATRSRVIHCPLMIIAIPDDYHRLVSRLDCYASLAGHDVRIFDEPSPAFDTLIENLRDAEVIVPIRERTRYTRELIHKLPRLRHIAQTGRSVRHIDVDACTARGIVISAGTHASPYTVAEHTWALILATLRKIPQETSMMKRGQWRRSFSIGLHGRTLGVFGLGKIGSPVAATGASFGMNILVWGRESSLAAARKAGYQTAESQEDLFGRSDVLALCVRLTKETRGIVTAAHLARMKPDALLVNTARAELIAPNALVEALRFGRPGYAAVDVYENEPVLRGDHPLLALDNALCTPHSAWIEKETYELYFGEAFANVLAFEREEHRNIVNPQALERR